MSAAAYRAAVARRGLGGAVGVGSQLFGGVLGSADSAGGVNGVSDGCFPKEEFCTRWKVAPTEVAVDRHCRLAIGLFGDNSPL